VKNQGVSIFIVFSALLILSGCMTSDQLPNGFTKMERANTMSLEKKEMEKSNKKSIQYFIVAKLKSVNEQPQEYLEFKSKRFSDRTTCVNWVNENNYLITLSLQKHVTNREKGYFVDSIKCINTKYFTSSDLEESYGI
jgi:hypothetical protein